MAAWLDVSPTFEYNDINACMSSQQLLLEREHIMPVYTFETL